MVVSGLQSDTCEYPHLQCGIAIIRIENPYIRIFRITAFGSELKVAAIVRAKGCKSESPT